MFQVLCRSTRAEQAPASGQSVLDLPAFDKSKEADAKQLKTSPNSPVEHPHF